MIDFERGSQQRIIAAGAIAGGILTLTGCGLPFGGATQSAEVPTDQSSAAAEATASPSESASPDEVRNAAAAAQELVGQAYIGQGLANPYAQTGTPQTVMPELATMMKKALSENKITDATTIVNREAKTAVDTTFLSSAVEVDAVGAQLLASGNFIDLTAAFKAAVTRDGNQQEVLYMPSNLVVVTNVSSTGVSVGSIGITEQYTGSASISEANLLGTGEGLSVSVRSLLDDGDSELGRIAYVLAPISTDSLRPTATPSISPSATPPAETCLTDGQQNTPSSQRPSPSGEATNSEPQLYVPCEQPSFAAKPKATATTKPASKLTEAQLATQWRAQVATKLQYAGNLLRRRVTSAGNNTQQLILNIDVENTAIQSRFAPGKPVKPVLELTKLAHEKGVAVGFSSGKTEASRAETARMLRDAGYKDFELCMRKPGQSLLVGKAACRAQFIANGSKKSKRDDRTIIMNIGNNEYDTKGDNFERIYNLPSKIGPIALP